MARNIQEFLAWLQVFYDFNGSSLKDVTKKYSTAEIARLHKEYKEKTYPVTK